MASSDATEVWYDQKGATVVREYTYGGVDYIDVVFDKTPDKTYTFIK